ncbi:MAG TPA: CPBP family intramembrane metalloprotease, partial [Limnochordia bacterium]|nr:CPBP family intramembrane metalloprotease [Limnochordia bacterium]
MLLLLVGAPLGEELFFRGLLVSLLRERLRAAPAVLLAALLFALLHFYTLQFVPVLVSGVLLGLLYVRTGSIIVPIAAHFAVNALALMALLSTL